MWILYVTVVLSKCSYKFNGFGRCFALKHIKLEIFACDNAVFAELHFNSLACQFRVVVLFREVGEPYMLKLR